MNDKIVFEHNSLRAQKARLSHFIASKDFYWLFIMVGFVLASGGLALVLILNLSIGWLAAGLAGPFWLVAGYGKSLRQLPPLNNNNLDSLLSAEVLGSLPAQCTPKQLAKILLHTHGGQFFAARFEVAHIIANIPGDHPEETNKIWQEAINLKNQQGQQGISSAVATAALIRTAPDIDQQLAALHLGSDDILAGIRWFDQLQEKIEKHKAKRHDGGVGRDWSFGYTPLLSHFGTNLSDLGHKGLLTSDLASRQAAVGHIMHLLSQGGRRNATLVGPLGVGKTTLVHSLAHKLLEPDQQMPADLKFRQVIALDPSSLISQARGRGELEELVHRIMAEAYNAKNVVLFLDDAQLFFAEGDWPVVGISQNALVQELQQSI